VFGFKLGKSFGNALDTAHITMHAVPISKPIGRKIIAAIAPTILFVALAFGSIQLKVRDLVGDTALVSLIGLSLLSAFILHFQDRIKELAWTGVKLRKAAQEVKDAEAAVRELAAAVLEVIDARPATYLRPNSNLQRHDKAIERLRDLV
jgi:hypothetical protein